MYSEIYDILDRLHILLAPALQHMIHDRLLSICKQQMAAVDTKEELPDDIKRISYFVVDSDSLPNLLTTDPIELERALLEERRK